MKVVRKVSFCITQEDPKHEPKQDNYEKLQNVMDDWCRENQDKTIINADINLNFVTHETQFVTEHQGVTYTGFIVFLTEI